MWKIPLQNNLDQNIEQTPTCFNGGQKNSKIHHLAVEPHQSALPLSFIQLQSHLQQPCLDCLKPVVDLRLSQLVAEEHAFLPCFTEHLSKANAAIKTSSRLDFTRYDWHLWKVCIQNPCLPQVLLCDFVPGTETVVPTISSSLLFVASESPCVSQATESAHRNIGETRCLMLVAHFINSSMISYLAKSEGDSASPLHFSFFYIFEHSP